MSDDQWGEAAEIMETIRDVSTKAKIIIAIVCAALLFISGYAAHSYRTSSRIANYEKREQQRMDLIKANDAAQDKLRGENKVLREHVAKLSVQDEGLKAIIENRGGVIAAEAKNLETINDELKNHQAVINAPTDRCIRCRLFSERAVARGQIGRPLACKDECAGTNQ